MNNFVKTQGLVNPVELNHGTTGGYLPGMNLGINEAAGRNQLLVLVFFVAAVLYALKKMMFRKKHEALKEKLLADYAEDNL